MTRLFTFAIRVLLPDKAKASVRVGSYGLDAIHTSELYLMATEGGKLVKGMW